ncbi:MAG: carboxyltransferase domain-containing protein, partial [Thermoanaerobaculia bacterium]
MELRPAGDRGILAVLDRTIAASALHAAARAAESVEGVLACIPGHSSLLTIWSGTPDREALRDAIVGAEAAAGDDAVRLHRIAVSFRDGTDLAEFLLHAGLSLDQFLPRVAALRLTARYLGFRAGFAYLDGWPEEWAMPRRATSRPHVDAGTFAIAGSTAGIYPIDSPGGWNLLGRTDAALWDEDREPPNLIAPGDAVEIVPTTAPIAPRRRAGKQVRLELSYAEVIAAPLAQIVPAADWRRVVTG